MSIAILILIFFFIFLLIKGTNLVIAGLRHLAQATHFGIFALSAVMLALATSLPELSVAITSGLKGDSSLSLGNVLGANIANISLVAGGAALITGRVVTGGEILKREVGLALFAGALPIALILDGSLSRLDGLVLIAAWVVYVFHFFHIRFKKIAAEFAKEGYWPRFLHKAQVNADWALGRLIIGILLVVFSAELIVRLSVALAQDAGVELFIIGAVILAVGTTLPEFVFSLRSLFAGEPTMFLGNILGSIIANSTLIIGIASFLSPVKAEVPEILLIGAVFVLSYSLFWAFIRTKNCLDRREAAVLLILYAAFVVILAR